MEFLRMLKLHSKSLKKYLFGQFDEFLPPSIISGKFLFKKKTFKNNKDIFVESKCRSYNHIIF